MKRLLYICAMIMAATTTSFAQSAKPDVAEPVSKAEFVAKVVELDRLIGVDKADEAQKMFGNINQMVNAELKVTRYRMRDAGTEAEKNEQMKVIRKQRGLLSQALSLSRADITANRVQLVDKLNEFAATME